MSTSSSGVQDQRNRKGLLFPLPLLVLILLLLPKPIDNTISSASAPLPTLTRPGMEMLGFHHKVPSLQQQAAAAAAANPRAGFMWQVPGVSRSAAGSGVTVAEAAAFFPGGSDPAMMGAAGHGWQMDHNQRVFTAGMNDDDDDPDPPPQVFGDPQQQQRGIEGALALSLFDSPSARAHDAGNRVLMWPQQQQNTYHSEDQHYQQQQLQQQLLAIRYSKYLAPTQDLLYEFCNVGPAVLSPTGTGGRKNSKSQRGSWEDGGGPSPSSTSNCWNQQQSALQSLDAVELQRRKAKLVLMLDEVDRRYRRYCDQMRDVVASFESVAGEGAAAAYSTLASRAMSKHFRCLKDGILGQIRSIKKATGGEVGGATNTTGSSTAGNGAADSCSNANQQKVNAGEQQTNTAETTPRLKLLDQCFRQQKLFHQGGLMGGESSHPPWRPQRGLPERSVSILRAWLFEHFLHPYPSDVDKHILARQTGLSRSQVSNWFINARVRLWKPMVEEMYLEEQKEQEDDPSSSRATTGVDSISTQLENIRSTNLNPTDRLHHSQGSATLNENCKPDPDCLSSVVIGSHALQSTRAQLQQQQQVARFGPPAAASSVNLDFSSYGAHHHQGFGNSAVSLTLGLQQQGEDGMGISFSPSTASGQSQVLFAARDGIENCGAGGGGQQAGQYFSVLDGDGQGMSLPYRDLMGAQLLHDLAG